MSDRATYRPPVQDRWGTENDRTEPVRIEVRTEWLYSEPREPGKGCICCPGRHAFSRGGSVVTSDVPARYITEHDLMSHVHRAIALFGDDADLVIEVKRKEDVMKTEAEVRAELAEKEQELASGRKMSIAYSAALFARVETLRWVLGMEPTL